MSMLLHYRRAALIYAGAFLCLCAAAQSGTVGSGGEGAGSGGTISFTIGQPIANTLDLPDYTVYEGVQQPYELFVTSIDDSTVDNPDIVLFPNPTAGEITMRFHDGHSYADFRYVIYDVRGVPLRNDIVRENTTHIQVSDWPAGTYHLYLTNGRQPGKSFHIIKN